MYKIISLLLSAALVSACTTTSEPVDPPNILWLVSEDNSPLLGSYGDELARTPNLDQLAKDGILYTHAFANAPVCAPARSTIISGMYASSLGTQHMRSSYAIPDFVRFFPYYLQKAGYYCTNNAKEDYNMPQPDTIWNESSRTAHYKNREEGQPFFAVFNMHYTHESSLHTYDSLTVTDPDKIALPPYHPDTEEIRHDWAQYYDRVAAMDSVVGNFLDSLKAEGLSENTIVFYYSDHGGVLARSKRFLYETGTHVPFIVRFPEKFSHLAPAGAGAQSGRIISFVDLAPTVLNLAGIELPDYMQGQPFLGSELPEKPEYTYMFRGRMDERYDMVRSIRNEKYRYTRNYMPFRPWGQHLEYLWKAPNTQSWEREFQAGNTNAEQSIFWQVKPAEELYDVEADPYEVHNLAGDPNYETILTKMRANCQQHSLDIKDVGFIPEAQYAERFGEKPAYEVLRNSDIPLGHIIQSAHIATLGSEKSIPHIVDMLDDPDPTVRYWGATGCIVHGQQMADAKDELAPLLNDPSPAVRIAAAEAFINIGESKEAFRTLTALLDHDNPRVQLHTINALQMLGEKTPEIQEKMTHLAEHGQDKYIQRSAGYFMETHYK